MNNKELKCKVIKFHFVAFVISITFHKLLEMEISLILAGDDECEGAEQWIFWEYLGGKAVLFLTKSKKAK